MHNLNWDAEVEACKLEDSEEDIEYSPSTAEQSEDNSPEVMKEDECEEDKPKAYVA